MEKERLWGLLEGHWLTWCHSYALTDRGVQGFVCGPGLGNYHQENTNDKQPEPVMLKASLSLNCDSAVFLQTVTP